MEKQRCYKCNKKIKSLVLLKCKCEQYFCKKHKNFDEHNCDFDYKLENQEKLKKFNQIVKSDKFQRL